MTLDALGTQTEIVQTIVDQQADYVLALKGNEAHLYVDVLATFDEADVQAFAHVHHTYAKTVERGMGGSSSASAGRSTALIALKPWAIGPAGRTYAV